MRFAALTLGILTYLLSFSAPAQSNRGRGNPYPQGQYPQQGNQYQQGNPYEQQPQMVSAQQRQGLQYLPQTVVMRQPQNGGQAEFYHANQLIYPNQNLGYQVNKWNFQNASYGQYRSYGQPWQFTYSAYAYRGYYPQYYNQYPIWNYGNWGGYYNYYQPYYGNQWYVPQYYYGGYNYSYQYYYYYNYGGYNYYFYRSPWWW
ncbi:MAG: hypothetical protein K2X47_08490 [Bdellovibrionales bacterium]|nr:hypothetical protein [Bdellovibrionales bacterium]